MTLSFSFAAVGTRAQTIDSLAKVTHPHDAAAATVVRSSCSTSAPSTGSTPYSPADLVAWPAFASARAALSGPARYSRDAFLAS